MLRFVAMAELLVFYVVLTDRGCFKDAFRLLSDGQDADNVQSCAVDAADLSARFIATGEAGDDLIERLYAQGGLRWCTRHRLRAAGTTLASVEE